MDNNRQTPGGYDNERQDVTICRNFLGQREISRHFINQKRLHGDLGPPFTIHSAHLDV